MSLSMRSMPADSWRPRRAAAPPGKRILGKPSQLQTERPLPSLQRDRACFSPHFPRSPRLIRSVLAVVAGLVVGVEVAVQAEAALVEELVVAVEVAVQVEELVVALGAVPVAAQGVRAAVKVALVEPAAPAVEPGARVVVLAAAASIPRPTSTIRLTTSRGRSCRHFLLPLRRISRFSPRWRKAQAVSRFSIPMTC